MDIFSNFNLDRLLFSLQYMWKGMLCIFVVIAVIILSVILMNFISGRSEARKNLEEDGEEIN